MTQLHSVRNQGSVYLHLSHSFLTVGFYSAIHKAAAHRSAAGWKDPQRLFPIDSFTAFSGIVPGKAGNGSASSFVNSVVNCEANYSVIHKAAGLMVPGHSTGFPCIIPKISKEATVQNALGFACFPEYLQKFSERQILWSLCSVDFHIVTLKLSIHTSLSVAPKLQVSLHSGGKC